jgi:hypothetical protein
MDAIEFLKEQHQKAKAAIGGIEQALSPTTRALLWSELKPDLEAHEEIEDACLYGPLSQDAEAKDERLVTWRHKSTGPRSARLTRCSRRSTRWTPMPLDGSAPSENCGPASRRTFKRRGSRCWDGARHLPNGSRE